MFELVDNCPDKAVIKVIGVGGGGGNAVEYMLRSKKIEQVEFVNANTDALVLKQSAARILQLGTKTTRGLGAGADPEIGKLSAEEDSNKIKEVLEGADILFITAGMGGGTGTGAAPIVAQVAKEMGILTVGVISKPFDFEGVKRLKVAENGATELESYVDSLIVVLNEKLFEVMGEDAEFDKAFACADDVLHNAVSGIAEIINVQGLINVDFEDVKTVMGEQGKAMMGTATVSGMDRARLAAEAAVASPLLEGVDLSGARGVLVNITASRSLKLSETREVMAAIRGYAADDATVIFGTVYDESLGDALRVTVVATGLNNPQARQNHQPEVVWRQATGTHDAMPTMADLNSFAPASASAAISKVGLDSALGTSAGMALTGSASAPVAAAQPATGGVDYSQYDLPRVFRSSREATPAPTLGADSSPQAKTLLDKGADYYEIPAFLRKQAD